MKTYAAMLSNAGRSFLPLISHSPGRADCQLRACVFLDFGCFQSAVDRLAGVLPHLGSETIRLSWNRAETPGARLPLVFRTAEEFTRSSKSIRQPGCEFFKRRPGETIMPCQPRCGPDASTWTHVRDKAANQVDDVPSQALQTRGARRILIAGIGNIFFGDDAFGCEVAAELAKRSWPDGVSVVDFGIRAYDLAYAMMDGYDVTILIDAAPRNEKPGTVYLLELDPDKLETGAEQIADAHALTPVRVLQLIRALGGQAENLYLVGCEPARLEAEGVIGLSEEVRHAIPIAVEMIETIVGDLARGRRPSRNFSNLPTNDMRTI